MSGRHRAPRSHAVRGFVAGAAAGGMIAAAIGGGFAAASDTTPSAQIAADASQIAALASDIQAQLAAPTATPSPSPTDSPSPTPSDTPTPTPSDTPSPSATPAATTGCLATPSACGYPDATNTGASGALTVYAGKFVTSSDGQVVENLDIQGCLQVRNAGVIIRNVRIEGGCTYSLDLSNATGHTDVTDTTIIASGSQAGAAVLRNATLTRVDVSGGNDGIDAWGGAGGPNIVQDSYVHDLIRSADGTSHDDTLQTSGGDETFRHNTLLPFTNGDPMNSCLQIGALQGNLDQLTFTDNLCDGGNYSINANNSGVGTTVTAGPLTFTGNRFGTDYRYGVKTHLGAPFSTTWSGNVDDATGNAIG